MFYLLLTSNNRERSPLSDKDSQLEKEDESLHWRERAFRTSGAEQDKRKDTGNIER